MKKLKLYGSKFEQKPAEQELYNPLDHFTRGLEMKCLFEKEARKDNLRRTFVDPNGIETVFEIVYEVGVGNHFNIIRDKKLVYTQLFSCELQFAEWAADMNRLAGLACEVAMDEMEDDEDFDEE